MMTDLDGKTEGCKGSFIIRHLTQNCYPISNTRFFELGPKIIKFLIIMRLKVAMKFFQKAEGC